MSSKKPSATTTHSVVAPPVVLRPFIAVGRRVSKLRARRPHRSFRRTRQRDYKRSLKLPGYFAFTHYVLKTIWTSRKLLGGATLVYIISMFVIVGLASQEIYSQLSEVLETTSGDLFSDGLGQVTQAGLLLATTVSGNLNGAVTADGQIYASIITLLFWLNLVWLLRSILAGRKVKIRDALYNSGAPIVSTFLVVIVLFVQLIPLALATIVYSAASGIGMLSSGVVAMLTWIAIVLIGVISLYWSISTVIALVVVTLPGMYPLRAIKTAGDLVIGRRVRVFLRLLWAFVGVLLTWIVVMIPVIIFDTWLKNVWSGSDSLPLIPVLILLASAMTVLFLASYIYLLYRRVVDDDAKPA